MPRRLLLRLLVCFSALIFAVLPATPAFATDQVGVAPPAIDIEFGWLSPNLATQHDWCANGYAEWGSAAQTWVVSLVAVRSDGSTYAPTPRVFTGATMNTCLTTYKLNQPTGNVTVTVTFTAAGGDVTFTAVANSTWLNGTDAAKDWHNT